LYHGSDVTILLLLPGTLYVRALAIHMNHHGTDD